MTTRHLELASEALTQVLDQLWESERALALAKMNHEDCQRTYDSLLEKTHKAMAEFKVAAREWQQEQDEA